MNWNDYEAVWKRQELPLGAAADPAGLRDTFAAKSRKQYATLLVRDCTEAGAGGIVAGALGLSWWQAGRDGWPLAGAIALVLGVAGFFLRERLRARRARLGAEAPLLAKVAADLAELRHQAGLLRRVGLWYLAPCAGAIAIQLGVIVRRAPAWSPVRDPLVLLGFGLFFTAVLAFVWLINRRAVRRQLEPRIAELEKLQRELSSVEPS